MENKKLNLKVLKITTPEALEEAEKKYRETSTRDYIAFSNGTPWREIAETVIPDQNGDWLTPIYLIISEHNVATGINALCSMARQYLSDMSIEHPLNILSITANIGDSKIILKSLIRSYTGMIDFTKFFEMTGDDIFEDIDAKEEAVTGNLVIPDEIKNFSYDPLDIKKHDEAYKKQLEVLNNCTKEKPFLNQLTTYVPKKLPMPEDKIDLIYDLKTSDMSIKTITPYEEFDKIFKEILTYVSGVEYYHYKNVMLGDDSEENFMKFLENYIDSAYVRTRKLDKEDLPTLMKKLYKALFQFYVIQDLIDDPMVTDIKITAPDSIRARVKGKAYMSNIEFVDEKDYRRFLNGLAIKNRIRLNVPEQTFTDTSDPNYILRMSITSEYVNSVNWPYLHVRKVDRHKPLRNDLIAAGMFDEKISEYLLDCAKNSRGVVFAGPPGSGKTVCLNWFLEEGYEQSAEILVIQENDELFAYRKGVMFQHVINYPQDDQMPVDLEELGRLALVAGANVFVIGEAKGPEICSAITLSNSGCRTALTIHSYSSVDTIDKMADLALRGYAKDIDQAKRMLKSFDTIVYLENFKIKEISKVVGYNEDTHDMEYKYIYRREEE